MLNSPHVNRLGVALAVLVAALLAAALLFAAAGGEAGGMLDSRWLSR